MPSPLIEPTKAQIEDALFNAEMDRRRLIATVKILRRNLGALIQVCVANDLTPATNEYVRLAAGTNLATFLDGELTDGPLPPMLCTPDGIQRLPADDSDA